MHNSWEQVNISLVKWNLGDIINKTHVVLIISQNKMCAKFRTLPFSDFPVKKLNKAMTLKAIEVLFYCCIVDFDIFSG